jgi:protein-tyrosine-phosphatase
VTVEEGGAHPAPSDRPPVIVVLCTGNAARSVMAGAMLDGAISDHAPVRLVTAGTHVVDGQPMSRRTRCALEAVGVGELVHRSHQVTPEDIEVATLVVAMAGDHVGYVRRTYPAAAAKTATIKRLCRDLDDGSLSLSDRIRALDLASTEVEPWEDVEDPAGGEDEDYLACAKELLELCTDLAPRLG